MGAASISLPQKLVVKLREKAEELGAEFVLKGLNEELDHEDLVEH